MKRVPTIACLMVLAVLASTTAGWAGDGDSEHEAAEIKGATTLELRFRGQKVSFPCYATSLNDEFMVRADAPQLRSVAAAFGKQLTWSPAETTLTGSGGTELKLGQKRLPDNDEGRELAAPAQVIEGAVHVPLSCLEEFLGARVTVRNKVAFVEPVIRSVRLEGEGRDLKLVIESTAEVPFKTFRLRQPDRFVIDVSGAVLDTPSLTLHHPEMGAVRLGQFELGPAVSRIVVPTTGVSVQGVATGKGRAIGFAVKLPKVNAPAQDFPQEKITDVVVEAITGGQRIELVTSGPVQYEWTRLLPPDNRFILDIPGAVLTGKKENFEFEDPYLGAVRVSQFQVDPKPVVRVVAELERPAETRILPGTDQKSVVLEVRHKEIEPRMAVLRGFGTTAFPQAGGVICIDAGHGGSDPGAINRGLGVTEKEVTLDISHRLAKILKQQGWNVVMTRTDDRDVSWAGSSAKEELGARAKVANDMKADLFVSIHCNASTNTGVNGTSLHYYKQGDLVLARSMHGSVLSGTGRVNRGLSKNRFYVLAHTNMPAVLVETAFLTNHTEGSLLASAEYRQQVAESIAEGLRVYASQHMNWVAAGR